MYIDINDEWRLSSDKYQWIIQRRYFRKDREEAWRNEGYFVKLEQACAELVERDLRLSGCTTLAEALERVDYTQTSLLHALNKDCSGGDL